MLSGSSPFPTALRRLRHRPGFALLAVVMLGLGLGAAIALYSILHAVLFRPLPVRAPHQLVQVGRGGSGEVLDILTYPEFVDQRDRNPAFQGVLINQTAEFNLQDPGASQTVSGAFVSPSFFPVLGVTPVQGRGFGPDDEQTWNGSVVLGYALAQRLFVDSPALGRSLRVNGHLCTIIGVAPRGFRGGDGRLNAQVWLPFAALSQFRPAKPGEPEERLSRELPPGVRNQVLARLRPGINLRQAQLACRNLDAQLAQAFPPDPGESASETRVWPLGAERRADIGVYLPHPGMLFLASGLLLLLACANVANLLLADASRRRKEFSLRLALGAPGRAILQQLLGESLVLALLGAALGLAIGQLLAHFLLRFQAATLVRWQLEVGLDPAIIGFALLLAVLCALLFGLAPAWQCLRPGLLAALKDGGGASPRRGLKEMLVVAQVALSLALVSTSALVFQSLHRVQRQRLGYEPDRVATLRVREGFGGYSPERGRAFRRQLLERVQALPGVRQAAVCMALPREPLRVRFRLHAPGEQTERTYAWGLTGPGYFGVMGIPLLAGRDFTDQDGSEAAPVAVVSEAFARAHWGEGQAVGQVLLAPHARDPRPIQVIGVVGNLDQDGLGGPQAQVAYSPIAQREFGFTCLVVRTDAPEPMLANLRRIAGDVAPDLPIANLVTLRQHLDAVQGPLRLAAWLLGGFGGVSLLLSALGVYAMQTFRMGQRRRELSIRMALGAGPRGLVGMVLMDTLRWTVLGLALGSLGAFALARLAQSVLVGVGTLDLVSLATAILAILAAAILATLVPALRAVAESSAMSLRED